MPILIYDNFFFISKLQEYKTKAQEMHKETQQQLQAAKKVCCDPKLVNLLVLNLYLLMFYHEIF